MDISMIIKNILILTTKDNFYLRDLLLKINSNKNYNFIFLFVNEYNNFSNIFTKFCLLGLLNSLNFFLLDFLKKVLKKSIEYKFIKNSNCFFDNSEKTII